MTTPEHHDAVEVRDAMLAGLVAASTALAEVGRDLYKTTVMTKLVRGAIVIILTLLLGALVGLFIVAAGNRSNGNAIKDCTQPTGLCFKENQARTAQLISQLVLQGQAASYCSPRSTSTKVYRTCIDGYVKGAVTPGG